MILPSRPSDFDARYLRRLVGTKVTTFYDFDPLQQPSASPSASAGRSWIITEKLLERAVHLTQEDVDTGVGSPMTVGKFLCHLEVDPTQIAFMQIYYQIPIAGTEDADLATLAQQIQPPEFLVVMSNTSYGKKVPGESLTEESFWSLSPPVREDIRVKFRLAFEEMLRRISGLRRGWPIRDKLQWPDTRYVAYALARRPNERDWREHPEKWEV
ncbi:hypothetical protein N7501_004943 [Penicillium viridicatum]|nr:hypothetical protein N7501_004943 [Penicillium viridicatum]